MLNGGRNLRFDLGLPRSSATPPVPAGGSDACCVPSLGGAVVSFSFISLDNSRPSAQLLDQLPDELLLRRHVELPLVRLGDRPADGEHGPRAVAADPQPAVAPDGRLEREAGGAELLEHDDAARAAAGHEQPARHAGADRVEGVGFRGRQRAQAVGLACRRAHALELGVHVLVGEADARVDEGARLELRPRLLRRALEGERGQQRVGGVRRQRDEVEVARRVVHLAQHEVARRGHVPPAAAAVLYPQRVPARVRGELARDGGHDRAGRHVPEAGPEAQGQLLVRRDGGRVDGVAGEDDGPFWLHGSEGCLGGCVLMCLAYRPPSTPENIEQMTAGPAPGDRVAIGITFGNSNSSIAYTVDDKAEVIANEDGDRQIPTILSYVGGDEYYGQQAKAFLVRNPKNTVAYFKDFLGQEFKSIDPTHCHASAHPQQSDNTVAFSFQDKEGEDVEASTVPVSEVTTRYLRRLVGSASDYLGKKVTSAVISVPTNFSDKQRAALIAAANAADLEVLQLISDPISSLLAYDARPEAEVKDKIVVVADLGGTRSDVAVVASRSGMYTVLATAHDYEFVGAALDKVLMDHFAKEFLKKHAGVDPRENTRALAKLKLEAESTKKALSLGNNASFSVESLAEGYDFASTINRLRYETIARTVFEGFNRLVESVVKKAGLDVLDIDEVIMAGGTSHTPRIAANFGYIFPQSTAILAPSTAASAINPSELQARGAALQASLVQEYEADDIEQSTHPAVTTVKHITNAIGVITLSDVGGDEVFTPIIPPETAVPARRTVHVAAPKEGGDVLIKVVEGGTHIKVTKPEPKAAANGDSKQAKVEDDNEDDDDDSDFDDSDDEEEEHREKVWKIGGALAEAAIKGVKPDGKIEVTINVTADLGVTITAREVGAKGGVRGTL
ncbi:uncharacterized protein E0L32_008412 [Thyridium curvatum]|uniref:Uncharacterized protein n=1 Tax=Thyridium curvatum TaxID=1093900 RepID=A0A507B139_9PEZI|nr:uncharacterized protein E0L32_008412 [Thyridium curvatum]TPX10678.1 hypothetical protein E0L32_008412 [Thyridium curvatum]